MKENATSLKKRLIAAVLAMVMLVSALAGTTFAWFTDSVTSAGNKIQTGTLRADLLHKVEDKWVSLKENPEHKVFNYDKWEPGYTLVEQLKVTNNGTLALKYRLSVEVAKNTAILGENGENLADVIDVYVLYGESDAADFAAITADGSKWVHKGTLAQAMAKPAEFMGGELTAGAAAPLAIALHMQESAGNAYQELSVGDIYVNLIATQLASESDSFGPDYDKGATFPEMRDFDTVIEVNAANGVVTEAVTKDNVTVPAGVKLQNGTTSLGASVKEKNTSDTNLTLGEGEIMRPVDVHVEGVAPDNTVAIIIDLGEVMPKGLNIGNYTLYHVENGQNVPMTAVAAKADLDAHNEFYYDPATGEVTVAMATFSEVAMIADTEAKWEGNADHSWYVGKSSPYTIANADQLWSFSQIVGGMAKDKDGNFLITYTDSDGDEHHNDSFSEKTVKLVADIDLNDAEASNTSKIFYPIGYWNNEGTYERLPADQRVNAVSSGFYTFEGTFDGNGHTVENFYHNTWEMKGDHNWYDPIKEQYFRDGMGLFGRVYGGTVKNLTVKNFSSDGEITTTGVIAAYADFGATFENIAIFDCNPRVYNIGNGGIVGCVGWYTKDAYPEDQRDDYKVTFRNITVDNSNKISALWGSYDVACGGVVGQYYPTSGQSSANYPVNAGISFENCHVSAIMDVYNDVCANYQYYAYRYTGMLIGSVRENVTIDGKSYPKMDGITASGCTVHFGDWNDYYYCELVANSLASYTHDHQMSRLEQVASVDVANKTVTSLDGKTTAIPASGRVNYVVVKAKDANGMWIHGDGHDYAECYHFVNGVQHFHDVADADNPNPTETVNGVEGVLKEDKQLIYREFNQLFTGYGWGVTSKGITDFNGITNMDITLGDQESSAEKFEDAGYTPKDYRPGETITIGDLFKVKGNAVINGNSVYVSVSPITDGDKVSATFELNAEDWTKSTITFAADSTGTAKVTITDYIFCTATTIYLNEEEKVEKFTANTVAAQNAYTQITLGTLFGVKGGATIGNVNATVTDPNGNKTTVTGTSSDWATKTFAVVKEGTWTVSIVDDDKYCAATETTFTVNKVDKFTKKFDKDFLYRVGNAENSPVTLGTLFGDNSSTIAPVNVSVTITNVEGDAEGTFTSNATWTSGKIQFTGTGIVTVTIVADGANALELKLEVINATNATTATSATSNNVVLLQDITGTFSVSGGYTFYGNGFKVTLPTASSSKYSGGFVGYINLSGGNLDNVQIIGHVFPVSNIYREQAGNETDGCTYFHNSVIINDGSCKITNSYISGSRAAIYVKGGNDILIENTTVSGGAYANIQVSVADSLTLRNVTTVQKEQKDSYNAENAKKSIIGLGIVIDNASTEVYVEGTLNQYNWITAAQWSAMLGTYENQFPKLFTDSTYSAYWHYRDGDNSTKYVNLSMIFACNWKNSKLHDNRTDKSVNYQTTDITVFGNSGAVFSVANMGTLTDALYLAPTYVPAEQYPVAPKPVFDFTNKNYQAPDSTNVHCYKDGDTVKISFDEGGSKIWDTSILTATKLGNSLSYTVSMGGVDYTGKSITFTTGGDYVVTYTYTDPYNYKLDADGNIVSYEKEYTQTVNITVTAVAKTANNAEFTMGTNGTAVDKILVGNDTYLSAKLDSSTITNTASATFASSASNATTQSIKYSGKTNGSWASTTINGNTFYFPVVAMGTTDNKFSHTGSWYGCFPVFEGVITITDYADGGTGAEVVYNGSTTTLPTNLAAIYPQPTFRHQGTTTKVPTTPSKITKGTYNGKLCYTTQTDLSASNERSEEWVLAKYTYTDNAGKTYYWFVAYYCAESTNGGCVTPDTLITLADGTQKRVDELSFGDKILAWDFFTGTYVEKEISLLVNHGEGLYRVANLVFSDETTLRVIAEHGVFDYDLNKFVYITVDNMQEYVGHRFVQYAADGSYNVVTLTSAYETEEYTSAWSVSSAGTSNAFASGLLTVAPPEDFYNWIEMGGKLIYDVEQFQQDVETYGLYTYEDFADYVTYEQFVAWNGAYLKIAVEKGYFTFDYILELIELYKGWMPNN